MPAARFWPPSTYYRDSSPQRLEQFNNRKLTISEIKPGDVLYIE